METTAKINQIEKEKFLDYCVGKIDTLLTDKNMSAKSKRKFKETTKIQGIVYKFPHFGVEVVSDQVTIFGKYKSQFFDIEAYDNNEKLLEELLPRIEEFYHNPMLTKHPFLRLFSRLKKKLSFN